MSVMFRDDGQILLYKTIIANKHVTHLSISYCMAARAMRQILALRDVKALEL